VPEIFSGIATTLSVRFQTHPSWSETFSGATNTAGAPSNGSEKFTLIFHCVVQRPPEYVPGQSAAPVGVTLFSQSMSVVELTLQDDEPGIHAHWAAQ